MLLLINIFIEIFFSFCLICRTDREQMVTNVCLQQPYNIASAYSKVPYTNYTAGFKDCLDYIFYETDDLKVVQV